MLPNKWRICTGANPTSGDKLPAIDIRIRCCKLHLHCGVRQQVCNNAVKTQIWVALSTYLLELS